MTSYDLHAESRGPQSAARGDVPLSLEEGGLSPSRGPAGARGARAQAEKWIGQCQRQPVQLIRFGIDRAERRGESDVTEPRTKFGIGVSRIRRTVHADLWMRREPARENRGVDAFLQHPHLERLRAAEHLEGFVGVEE